MSCQMPVWINYVLRTRSPSWERGCDKWRQKKHKPKCKKLADRSRNGRRHAKGGEGMGQGVVEHVKHWAIKFATCSHVHSWAEAAVAMMGPLLPFNRGTEEAEREGAQQRVEAKDNFLMCFLPCGPLITPCHRATQPDRATRVLNLIALQIAWLNSIYK